MDADRWKEFDRIWHTVLGRPPHERTALVAELCAGNDSLRHDVESLLAHLERASAAGFGSAPAGRQSLVGRRLGSYTIQAWLGAGGMGEVYQAHDATLGRDVAIKIVPEAWIASVDRRARFDREASLLASLNHPNIGAIYGVQESDGVRALVLELVGGNTLAERIARQTTEGQRRGLPVEDVMSIAVQIADAIEAAHTRGIIHRDLKPANIKITPDGRVKVLDFGLARAMDTPVDTTLEGTLLGTPGYMSPEQARGRPVDMRTDIWAFGCVVYEMLTGGPAFAGEGIADVLANVIGREPDWSALPPDTPPAVRQCLRRCLQKDDRQRLHHIADVRLAMEGAFAAEDDRPARRARRLTRLGRAAAAIVLAVGAVGVGMDYLRGANGAATPPVLYSPRIGGGGSATAATIQDAINSVAPGGTVSLLPGTYPESVSITKSVTIVATGERSGAAVVDPPAPAGSVIEIATTEPVTLRGLTVHVRGADGIRARGAVDLTVERSTLLAVNPPQGRSRLIEVTHDGTADGPRARVAIRDSLFDGAVDKLPPKVARPQNHAIRLAGDVDGVIQGNTIRRFGGICLLVGTRPDLGGRLNTEILGNEIDQCHELTRVAAIKVGIGSVLTLTPDTAITVTGTVNIIGNTIRNSSEDCVTNAIAFDSVGGRIERNRILNYVQTCASPNSRSLPGAIWLGLWGAEFQIPRVAPVVRFNDLAGNAHAGLRLSPRYPVAVDATCNYWGSARGPSSRDAPAEGDVLIVGKEATPAVVVPFATEPIARTTRTGC